MLYTILVEGKGADSIGLRLPDWKSLAFAALGTTAIFVGGGLLFKFLLQPFHLEFNATALQRILELPYGDRAMIVLRAAIVEETLFRGYGIERLQELTGSRFIAAGVPLAVFALAHASYWGLTQILFAGMAGLVLTVLYLWRRDLASNMIAHFLTDAAGILLR